MDTSKLKTLDQISDAMDAVEDARAIKGLSATDKDALENTSVALRDIERSIIKSVQDEMVAKIKADTEGLKTLTAQIDKSSKKLDSLAAVLMKTTQAIEGLVNVITVAVGAGLL